MHAPKFLRSTSAQVHAQVCPLLFQGALRVILPEYHIAKGMLFLTHLTHYLILIRLSCFSENSLWGIKITLKTFTNIGMLD